MSQTKAQLVVGLNVNASAPATALQIDASGNINLDSNTLYVDASNNRVGVGVSSPSDVLHVEGTIRTSSSSNNAQFANNFLRSNQAGTFFFDQNSGGQDFAFRVSNVSNLDTTAMTIKSSGRVGIGTSSPGVKLTVVGSPGDLAAFSNATDASVVISANSGVAKFTNDSVSGSFAFGTGSSGTERLRITSAGNVGIGTTSPALKLHVEDSGSQVVRWTRTGVGAGSLDVDASGNAVVNAHTSSTGIAFHLQASEKARLDSSGRFLVGTSSDLSGGDADARLQVVGDGGAQILLSRQDFSALTAGTLIGEVVFRSQASGVAETSALIKCEADATQGSGDKPGRLVFSTTNDGESSPSEKMRIRNTGELWTLSTSSVSQFSTTQGAGTTYYLYAGVYGASNTAGANGTTSFRVWSNGNVQNTNNSYTAISDLKLKENIVDAGSQWSDIKALQVRNYNLKEGQTHRQIGLIAQEVEPISPGLVYETPDRDAEGNDLGTVTKSVNYSVLYMKAVKALQEAMERIEQLEAKVAVLETK